MFEDLFGKQNDDLNLDSKEVESVKDEWDTKLAPKQNDVWSTGHVNDVWSVG